jgi:ribonuclease Z
MKFEVTILGNSSATPVFNRNPTAQLLNCNEHYYLIDCGEGTQHQLIKYGFKAAKIDHIFISHLHGDHFFGLVGLLSSMHLYGRTKPLNIFGPPALKEILDVQFLHSETSIRYPLNYYQIDASKSVTILKNNDVEVETIVLNHRIACTGFRFTEKKRLRKLIVEKLEQDNIPMEYYPMLKRGVDFDLPNGTHVAHLDYTADSAKPRVYCYCSDTMYDERYFNQIAEADTLYHEATFLHEMLERAQETHHTTALQAGQIATKVGAKKLLIGHFSSRYKVLDEILEEAKGSFDQTELALEGKTYQI